VTIYKCGNDKCQCYLSRLEKLNRDEKKLRGNKSSQFKLRYQYREYHFEANHLKHSKPDFAKVDINKVHNSEDILGLVLAFHVSFAITARKTAFILKHVFNIKISYQTVLNSAYHLDHSRDTLPATIAMSEASRTAKQDQKMTYITDGNPAYPAGIHFINSHRDPDNLIEHKKVIGLQNLDEESEFYRHYKQIIERLNRTYKFHIRPAGGFKHENGAIALTTLFVTHFNFLRPHTALNYKVPVKINELINIQTIQGKWTRIIDLARNLKEIQLPP